MASAAQIHGQEVEHFKNVFQLLSPIQQKIFKYLHWFCRNYRTVKPSHSHIAKEIGCCRDTVVQAIKQFEKNGWVVKIKQAWKTCTYIVKEKLLLLNLNDRNTFRKIQTKKETFSNNGGMANSLIEKTKLTQDTSEKIPTVNPTKKPTVDPTHIKKYSSNTLNANVNDDVGVQKTKKEPVVAIPHELDQLPISSRDKHVLSRYNLQTLRLAIEDYNSYKEIKQVKNIAAFLTSRCQEYRIKLLEGEKNTSESHGKEKEESGEIDVLENKSLSCALERALSAMKDRKVKVEALNGHIELIDAIPCQTSPICIDYEDVAFRGKLERSLRRWLPSFNLEAFSKDFLNSKNENLERNLSEDPENMQDRAKIPTLNPTIEPTEKPTIGPTHIKKYSSNTLNVNDDVSVQKTKKEPVVAILHELDKLPISSKDKNILSRYSLQILRLAIEDYNSYKEIKKVKNIAAFLTSRCQEYRIKLLEGEKNTSESHRKEKAEAREVVNAVENKRLSCALERVLNAAKDRKVKVEALNNYIELLDTIPCQNPPICIDYENAAFRERLERALRKWLPDFNLKAFSKEFLNSAKENQEKNFSEDLENIEGRSKIHTATRTLNTTATHHTPTAAHTSPTKHIQETRSKQTLLAINAQQMRDTYKTQCAHRK